MMKFNPQSPITFIGNSLGFSCLHGVESLSLFLLIFCYPSIHYKCKIPFSCSEYLLSIKTLHLFLKTSELSVWLGYLVKFVAILIWATLSLKI